MLAQLLRRWPNIETTLGQRLVFADKLLTRKPNVGLMLRQRRKQNDKLLNRKHLYNVVLMLPNI